jgi:hypothetical protein
MVILKCLFIYHSKLGLLNSILAKFLFLSATVLCDFLMHLRNVVIYPYVLLVTGTYASYSYNENLQFETFQFIDHIDLNNALRYTHD